MNPDFSRRIAVCFFVLCSCLAPRHALASDKHILDNGVTVVIHEMPASTLVSVYALIKTGSATEGKYLGTGISHFLEHMLFKGTKTRDMGGIAAQIQAAGGTINASTGLDYTICTITVPYESFDTALNVLADMLMNSVMDPKEMEKEREVIFGEMRLYDDDPDHRINESLFRNVYIKHPYRHPIIGYKELLGGVTRQDLLDYYHTHYVPDNIVLSVAGRVRTREILPKIAAAFKDFQRQRYVPRHLPDEPPQLSPRRYEEEYPTDLARLSIAFAGVSLSDPDMYALDVLAMILGEGRSSRLYQNVYKKKDLVHHISASNFTPVDRGVFEIGSLLEEKNVGPAIRAVWDEIESIKEKGVQTAELEKAKRQVMSEHIFGRQRTSHAAYSQAIDEAFTGDHRFSERYVGVIRGVTNKDIQRAAHRYLTDSAMTVAVLKPQRNDRVPAAAPAEVEAGEIRKYVLDNGLIVLLREDRGLPLISIRLSLQGGLRQEPVEFNGLSSMVSQMWTKGTTSLTAKQIAEEVESLGMGLGTLSGKNSLGISLDCLSEDWAAAFDLFEDMVKNPVFPEEEIVKVKEDMQAAVRARADDIFDVTNLSLKGLLFLRHPFRLDEGGTLETIAKIKRKDLMDFYERLAAANNMVLSVFGDIQLEEVLKTIQKKFGSIPQRDMHWASHHEELFSQPREKELSMNKEQAMVMFGFHGADLMSPDRYGLEVLTAILGSSFNGRLFNSVREQAGQAYSLGGSYIPLPDAGLIEFYVLTEEGKIQEVKDALRRDILRIQTETVSRNELMDIKTYLKGTFQAGLETNASLSLTSGLDELYGLGYQYYQHYGDRIDSVTAEDIRRLANQYLDLNRVGIVVTKPRKN